MNAEAKQGPAGPAQSARRLGAAMVLLAASAHALGAEPPAAYFAGLRGAGVPQAAAALVVLPLDGGALSVESGPATAPMSPASTMKIVTTWTALNVLGPAYTWRTEARSSAPLRAGVLEGDLTLVGGGDPTLVVENFWLLLQRLRGLGLREIRGDLVLDRSLFAPAAHDPEDFDGAELRAYNAGADALLVNFAAVTFDFVPDPLAQVARIVQTPPLAASAPQASVPLSGAACGDWRRGLRADFGDPLAPLFRGSFPAACGERSWHVSGFDHTEYVGRVFRALWERSGGSWRGKVRSGTAASGARVLAVHESRPLAEVIRDINKFSNNVMARQVFLTLGAQVPGRAADETGGATAVREFLAGAGLAMPELVLENGAGLSRTERIAPASLARLLAAAARSPLAAEFVASLPLAGVDGTMRARRAASGAAHLKTGMIADVRALAGFVHARSGHQYVIVAIVNHANAAAAQPAHDAVLQWLFENG
jgi:D-alanyl-D-alanine carboxypeptidase/D-alanyl-D-alanine-endopeptidase (penicillin-binding protein 4)